MRIIIPNDARESFTYFVIDRIYADKSSNFNYTERSSNGTFACFEWEQEEITYEYMKEAWKAFTESWDGGAEHAEYQLEDGSIVICPKDKFLSVFYGAFTDRYNTDESPWRDEVEKLVGTLSFDTPFAMEFNPVAYNMKRNVPTIVLTGRDVWRNNGERKTNSDFYPVVFRNMANLVYFTNYVEEAERLSFYYNEPDECIITPFCVIKRNAKGFGNTVLLRSISFNNVEMLGGKNVYEILKEELFWTKILIPLATLDFATLKAELENQEVPMVIQLRYFKLQSQIALRSEIEQLVEGKKNVQSKVNDYIRAITDQKISIHKMEETIREKTSVLERGLAAKPLEDEFKRLIKLPYIEKVSFSGTNMVLTTKPIQIDDGPFLGGYTITYDISTKNLKVHNNVNPSRYGDLAHPHIYQDGDICFGNYSDVFFRFETGEYYVGIELLHEFLSTYNPDDEWGRRLIWWDAEYVFEDMKARGILDYVEPDYDDHYYQIYGEHLPSMNLCPECGETEENCTCHRCQYCGRHEDDCECWICPECGGEVGNDCHCDRCESCNELVGDCECERCDECGELLDPYDQYSNHCTCERCPDDYEIFVDTDELGCCTECENWDCEYNCNENHAMTQEETLFDELEEAV
jgi:hypothetical protein